jgi:hypothetical protein
MLLAGLEPDDAGDECGKVLKRWRGKICEPLIERKPLSRPSATSCLNRV